MATEILEIRRIERREAPALAEEEYRRVASLAAALDPDEWSKPTECPGWRVRDQLAHVAGSMAGTSLREGARQRKVAGERAQTSGRPFIDEMNDLHIEERRELPVRAIVQELHDRSGPAVRARKRVPGPMRRMPIPTTRMTMGELLDVVLTRDVWMHRMDVCRATSRAPELTGAHDGRLVADVVREWADVHGEPFRLNLTGPAGGEFVCSGGGLELELDAVEFCRILSGRGSAEGLLATGVVF